MRGSCHRVSAETGACRAHCSAHKATDHSYRCSSAQLHVLEAGESSTLSYHATAAIHVVIKLEPPSSLLSLVLYLSSCLVFCITVFLLDPISATEIIHSAPQSLPGNHPLLSFFLSAVSCCFHRHNLVSWPICCFFAGVSLLCLRLCCFRH